MGECMQAGGQAAVRMQAPAGQAGMDGMCVRGHPYMPTLPAAAGRGVSKGHAKGCIRAYARQAIQSMGAPGHLNPLNSEGMTL